MTDGTTTRITAQVTVNADLVQHLDPGTLLTDRNIRDAKIAPAFVANIKERGVLQPVVAVLTAQGTLRVRIGHRRTLAAVAADLSTIPVRVVADEATDADGSIETLLDQWAENKHRSDLTTTEEMVAVEQLAAFGLTPARIAKRTGIDRKEVDAALVMARSEDSRAAVETFGLDLLQAAVLVEFEDDSAAVNALVQAAQTGRFEHTAQSLRDKRTAAAAKAAYAKTLTDQGLTVVDAWSDLTRVSYLMDPNGRFITDAEHAACPGHVAIVNTAYGMVDPATGLPPVMEPCTGPADREDDDEDGYDDGYDDEEQAPAGLVRGEWFTPVYGCSDFKAHGHRDRYSSQGAPKVKMADMAPAEAEAARAERKDVLTSNADWKSATTVRLAHLRALADRKAAPKGSAALIATALCHGSSSLTSIGGNHLAAGLLGVAVPSYGPSAEIAGLLTDATEARSQMLALLLVLCGYEDGTYGQSWRTVSHATATYLVFLQDATGYTLADVERRAAGLPRTQDQAADQQD